MGCTTSAPEAGARLRADSFMSHSRPDCVEEMTDDAVRAEYAFSETSSLLGRGGFGIVVRATRTDEPTATVALKILDKGALGGALGEAHREIALARPLAHAHVVRTWRAIESDARLYVVMDAVVGGSLARLIDYAPYDALGAATTDGWFSEALVQRLAAQLLSALAYLHSAHGVAHLDVSPANALLTRDPRVDARGAVLKLCDFGLARRIGRGARASRVFVARGGEAAAVFGTPAYCAPEMLRGARVGVSADVWSAGATLFHALCGERALDVGVGGFEEAARKADVLERAGGVAALVRGPAALAVWERLSEGARALVELLTRRAAEKRPSAARALAHVWFADEHVPPFQEAAAPGGDGVLRV